MSSNLREQLSQAGLKVTPQRVAVLESFNNAPKHPTAEQIISQVRLKHQEIAVGTIYNILDTLVDKGIISRVKTDRDIMRYDSISEKHHHLYCSESQTIADYYDDELNIMLEEYFRKKRIENFSVEEVKLQITGKFKTLSKTK
ncbi:MAG: transcriptional repressor [Bacteroidetes bacterium HGW-Bacteroidetes-7]|jgi:Fur family peroxide stress response transcriptional regulator|nr:MAG: transcriptional repressor [Bacteroidetes bacterium HGW-Bacteroidetes-7]